ncbi:hypothetical protein PQ478_09280 [Alkalihalophilus pseudofirmus]|uniref:hypothetical protein n=1 Tax=Alkalihalophilus pseudofirmus TaxID=79885 RepID=UPI00259B3B99|nr:hypothetical protein [Alkalihalophilus pseudofirmus]WEG18661.1 hypothetical protein PQ478_09280 [Alkalihalophilus pseudofirmus]
MFNKELTKLQRKEMELYAYSNYVKDKVREWAFEILPHDHRLMGIDIHNSRILISVRKKWYGLPYTKMYYIEEFKKEFGERGNENE